MTVRPLDSFDLGPVGLQIGRELAGPQRCHSRELTRTQQSPLSSPPPSPRLQSEALREALASSPPPTHLSPPPTEQRCRVWSSISERASSGLRRGTETAQQRSESDHSGSSILRSAQQWRNQEGVGIDLRAPEGKQLGGAGLPGDPSWHCLCPQPGL